MTSTATGSDTRPSGRHPVSIGHLVMGLAFLGLVGVWGLVQADVVDNHDIRWLLPLPWVLAGIAGLLATTLTSRDRWASRQTGWVQSGRPAPGADTADDTTDVDVTGTDITDADTTDTPEENR